MPGADGIRTIGGPPVLPPLARVADAAADVVVAVAVAVAVLERSFVQS